MTMPNKPMGTEHTADAHTPGWPCGGRIKCPACCRLDPRELAPADLFADECGDA